MIKFLILLGCCMSFWLPASNGALSQSLFLMLFLVAAIIAVVQGRVAPIPPSTPELVLYGTSILSAAVAISHSAEPSILFSMAFLMALLLISVLVRVVTLEELLDIGANVALVLTLTGLIFNRAEFVRALSITITRIGLFRFMPFSNHPDLTGFLFGASAILLARRALLAKSVGERILMSGGTALALIFILAASARASVVAVAVAIGLAVLREVHFSKRVILAAAGSAALAIVTVSIAFGDSALKYIQGILEINSRTRGIQSGGSGRTDLWLQGVATLFSDPTLVLFGGGLRSSDIANIGFSTEDSYITILLDSGLFMGSALIAVFLYCPIKAMWLSRPSGNARSKLILLPYFFVFIIVESIFNRYLLAIGNPLSLFALMTVMSLSVYGKAVVKSTAKAPRRRRRRPAHTLPDRA
jgi:exopolysaccharide production protein ExoQ